MSAFLMLVTMTSFPVTLGSTGRRHNPGQYLRLFDIPELCPHLSFVVPWSDTIVNDDGGTPSVVNDNGGMPAPQPEVILLEYGPLSISVTGLYSTKANRTAGSFEAAKMVKRPPPRRLKKKYDQVHSGPTAVLYQVVLVRWNGRLLLHIVNNVVLLAKMRANKDDSMVRILSGSDRAASVRVLLSISDSGSLLIEHQPLFDRLEPTVELCWPAANLTAAITFSDPAFSQRRQQPIDEDGRVPDGRRRPWIEFLSLPFYSGGDDLDQQLGNETITENSLPDVRGVMVSSGLLGGLWHLGSGCRNMFCLTEAVCGSGAAYCCPHLLGRVARIMDAAENRCGGVRLRYPDEYTANFVSFSRQFICPAAIPAFSAGCPPGWRRYNYRCYRLFVEPLVAAVTYRQAVSACRTHNGAKLVVFAPNGTTSDLYGNNMDILEAELDFVGRLIREVASRVAKNRRDHRDSHDQPTRTGLSVWVGGRKGFHEPCLQLNDQGEFIAGGGGNADGVGGSCSTVAGDVGDGYVCITDGCTGSDPYCCRLTLEEHLRWERWVLGKSFILRPDGSYDSSNDDICSRRRLAVPEHELTLKLAYGVIGGTIAFVVVYRIVTRELEQRRYIARSFTKY